MRRMTNKPGAKPESESTETEATETESVLEAAPEEEAAAPEEDKLIGGALGIIDDAPETMPEAAPAAEPKPVAKFKIVNREGVSVLLQGGKTQLKYGKIVDELNYDIERLRLSGVELEPVI